MASDKEKQAAPAHDYSGARDDGHSTTTAIPIMTTSMTMITGTRTTTGTRKPMWTNGLSATRAVTTSGGRVSANDRHGKVAARRRAERTGCRRRLRLRHRRSVACFSQRACHAAGLFRVDARWGWSTWPNRPDSCLSSCFCTPRSSWAERVGGPFDLIVSAIAIHNLLKIEFIAACYRGVASLLKPGAPFLDYDLFAVLGGIETHIGMMQEAGMTRVSRTWDDGHAAVLVGRGKRAL